jgi:hypothetical protein
VAGAGPRARRRARSIRATPCSRDRSGAPTCPAATRRC